VTDHEWTDYLDSYYESFGDFVSNAFVFATTPEGHEYWDYIRRSRRDGIEFVPKTKPFMKALQLVLDNINKPKGENLDDILKELNISKPKIKMTKLTLDVNPFLCKIDVSARLDGVVEWGEIHYTPLDYPCEYYVTLGEHTFKAYIDYIDTFHVEIFDEDSIAIPSKIKISK